ncbi:MAG: MBL fold metallo-hydrolase [Candidatus Kariarchaeaceae archaeon]|jgi:glyoxylase-like metal-dependent hydrolase (beta-lactamase superfamily II)/8-oxo-dGTP pyrophosphatase MutT (NUDIX family)
MVALEVIKSASIILQRTSGEVYLVRRSKEVSFFPGFWVFPGGKIDEPLDDSWEGTELEVIDTVFKEMYEEIGVVAGSDYIVPPAARRTPFFSQPYNEQRRREFEEKMIYIGKKQTPPFRKKLFNAAYFWIQDPLVDELHPEVDNSELTAGEWIMPEVALADWESGKRRIPPPILHLLRSMKSEHFAAITLSETLLPVGLQTKVEFAPGYQVIPITSATIEPFFNTNMIIIGDELVVDPGANNVGKEHLRELVRSFPKTPKVFITHHHEDHWIGVRVIEEIFPDAVVYAHRNTVERMRTDLKTEIIDDGYIFELENHTLKALETPGHADSHMVLFDEERKVLIAGDHVVGFGSAVLDPVTGSMTRYFESTRKMIDLDPKLVLPAHGPPNFAGRRLLEKYLEHRTDRENRILASINGGAKDFDQIIQDVYQDVPAKMWEVAKRNIKLHVEKLVEEGRTNWNI